MAALFLGSLSACGPIEPWVKPYERDKLADPIMALDGDAVSTSYIQPHTYSMSMSLERAHAVARVVLVAAAAVTKEFQ
jgi:hypothetical protein